jgi:hypothetical protein
VSFAIFSSPCVFSATSSRICKGILYILVALLGGVGVECHVASWIKVASSSSSASYILMFLFMWSSIYVRKRFQFVTFVISVGIFGLLYTWVHRVAITGVWSDDSSWLDSI